MVFNKEAGFDPDLRGLAFRLQDVTQRYDQYVADNPDHMLGDRTINGLVEEATMVVREISILVVKAETGEVIDPPV